jgi:quercetin dioxygenase-like cupin family protein
MSNFLNWKEHVGSQAEKFYKTTLTRGEQMLVGLNCLEPGQSQGAHAHTGSDKFYFVLEGTGTFTVGDEARESAEGSLVFAPAGVSHGVVNQSTTRLSLLVAIAPGPNQKP